MDTLISGNRMGCCCVYKRIFGIMNRKNIVIFVDIQIDLMAVNEIEVFAEIYEIKNLSKL